MNEKKIRLAILKELEKGNRDINQNNLGIETEDFMRISKWLEEEGLISDVTYYYDCKDYFKDTSVTLKGEQYLSDNSLLMKTYKGLKELRDWLKL